MFDYSERVGIKRRRPLALRLTDALFHLLLSLDSGRDLKFRGDDQAS